MRIGGIVPVVCFDRIVFVVLDFEPGSNCCGLDGFVGVNVGLCGSGGARRQTSETLTIDPLR